MSQEELEECLTGGELRVLLACQEPLTRRFDGRIVYVLPQERDDLFQVLDLLAGDCVVEGASVEFARGGAVVRFPTRLPLDFLLSRVECLLHAAMEKRGGKNAT